MLREHSSLKYCLATLNESTLYSNKRFSPNRLKLLLEVSSIRSVILVRNNILLQMIAEFEIVQKVAFKCGNTVQNVVHLNAGVPFKVLRGVNYPDNLDNLDNLKERAGLEKASCIGVTLRWIFYYLHINYIH